MRAPGELEVLLVQKKLFREPAELAKHIASNREGRATCVGDLLRVGKAFGEIAVATGPGQAADMHNVAARIQELGLVEEAESCLHDTDIRILECTRQRRDSSRLHNRVRVEEDEDVCVNLARTPVASGTEAAIVGLDHARSTDRILDLRAVRAVVHDDDLLVRERVEAAGERLTAVVGDHNSGSAHVLSVAATNEDSVTYHRAMGLDEANARYWDELCGTDLARSLGIAEHSSAELERFDRAYLDNLYPYLTSYVDWLQPRDSRVLEIGTGYGTLGRLLLARGADYYAVDIADGPVRMAGDSLERYGRDPAHAVRASVLDLPFAPQSFDAAAAIGSLHHTGDIRHAIREAHRVLKPGGRALVMLYNARSLNRLLTVPLARTAAKLVPSKSAWLLTRIERDLNEALEGAPHTDFFTKTEARRLFDAWQSATVRSENASAVTVFRHTILPRRLLLPVVGPTAGLDLYIRATR